MRVSLLASGSRGNCAFIETADCRLLIDAGLSGRETEKRLATLGVDASELDAILVTHEHHDHVAGIGPLARRYDLPVFIDPQTYAELPNLGRIAALHHFEAGFPFDFREVRIHPFSTTHDAVNPVGFVLESAEGKIGFAADLGVPTRLVADQLQQCRILILEANHDDQMLLDGPYPWSLKQRIRSRHGHLSNRDSLRLLEEVVWSGLEALFLAHLSEENNCRKLVTESFLQTLDKCGRQIPVHVGHQSQATVCFEV